MLPIYLFCIKANPSWSILDSEITSDIMAVNEKISIMEFGQESKFLFIMQAL